MESPAQNASASDFYINDHRLHFLPPDIVQIWWNGRCTRDEYLRMLDLVCPRMGKQKHFVISNLSNLKSIDAHTRQVAAMDPRRKMVAGIAMIGTTFHTRVLMMMLTTAIELIDPKERGKVRFFDTEREALDWITQQRERLGLGRNEPEKAQEE